MDNQKPIKENIIVECPRSPWLKQKIQMRGYRWDNGKCLFHCEGCEGASGADVCQRCIASLILMYTHGYKAKENEIVIPDFSILQ